MLKSSRPLFIFASALFVVTQVFANNAPNNAPANVLTNVSSNTPNSMSPTNTPPLQQFIPSPPQLSAKEFILMDYNSGQILAEKDSTVRAEPASLTKMMTVYLVDRALAEGRVKSDDDVQITEEAWRASGSRMFVEVNAKVKLNDLVRGAIIQSGNDACIALADHVAGSQSSFVQTMNAEAARLGMKNTHFTNVTGLPDPDHYTTAHDLAILAAALVRDFPNSYSIYGEKWFEFNGIRQPNRNSLLWRDPDIDGIKTGHTDSAGYCLVSSAKKNGMRLISVVMGTDSDKARADQSYQLLTYGFRFYETRRLYAARQPLSKARVWMGKQHLASAGLTSDLFITLPIGQYKQLTANMELQNDLHAPVQLDQQMGRLSIKLNDKTLVERNIVALEAIKEAGLWTKLTDYIRITWRKFFHKDEEKIQEASLQL